MSIKHIERLNLLEDGYIILIVFVFFPQAASMASAASENRKLLQNQDTNSRTINHPMALRKRMRPPRQPRPARRLPQVQIRFITFLFGSKSRFSTWYRIRLKFCFEDDLRIGNNLAFFIILIRLTKKYIISLLCFQFKTALKSIGSSLARIFLKVAILTT